MDRISEHHSCCDERDRLRAANARLTKLLENSGMTVAEVIAANERLSAALINLVADLDRREQGWTAAVADARAALVEQGHMPASANPSPGSAAI